MALTRHQSERGVDRTGNERVARLFRIGNRYAAANASATSLRLFSTP